MNQSHTAGTECNQFIAATWEDGSAFFGGNYSLLPLPLKLLLLVLVQSGGRKLHPMRVNDDVRSST
jgi:hypothetical protein